MNRAPWPGFNGRPIHEGDMIVHPSGEVGRVVFLPHEQDQWRVDYGTGDLSRLGLQIGDKGQARVISGGIAVKTHDPQKILAQLDEGLDAVVAEWERIHRLGDFSMNSIAAAACLYDAIDYLIEVRDALSELV